MFNIIAHILINQYGLHRSFILTHMKIILYTNSKIKSFGTIIKVQKDMLKITLDT